MRLGELRSMGWVSGQLYGEGERLSLTCIPGPSPSKMRIYIAFNSHTKQYEGPINSSVAVRVSRRAHKRSGGDILTL
jgi:hypothetical protein